MNKIIQFLIVFFILLYTTANAEVLFEDNFNYASDWQSAQTVSKPCGGYEVTQYDTPGDWTGSYWVSSIFCDDPLNQTYQVNGNLPRLGSGKSLEFWAESDGGWAGGRMIKKLSTPQTQVYLRMYVNFPSDFVWSDGTDHGYQKLMSISSVPPNIDLSDVWGRGTAYNNIPDFIWQNYCNYGLGQYQQYEPNSGPRNFNDIDGYGSDYDVNDYLDKITIDGNWHSYEIGVGLNSAPGVEDGFIEMYYDGVKIYSFYTIAWVDSVGWTSATEYTAGHLASNVAPISSMKGFRPVSTHTSGGTEPNWSSATTIGDIVSDGNGNQWEYYTDFKWNVVWILDNIYIGVNSSFEQKLYVDDVVASTEYIGPSYTIGLHRKFPWKISVQ